MSEARSLRIEKVPATPLVRVVWNGGGEVPAELSGCYTSHAAAKQAIAEYSAKVGREIQEESPSLDEAKEVRKPGRPPKSI